MKGYSVYSKIQQFKERGFRKDAVAKSLGINWRTVDRYWDMPVEEYEQQQTHICRAQVLDEYRDQRLSSGCGITRHSVPHRSVTG